MSALAKPKTLNEKFHRCFQELQVLCFPVAIKKKEIDILASEMDDSLFVTLYKGNHCSTFRLMDKNEFNLKDFKEWLNA